MIIKTKGKVRTDKKILIECDFKVSNKCKGQYYKLYKNVLKGKKNNNGRDRCQYCFNSITKTGKSNFNFRYKKHDDFFKNIDTEAKAYLLGWVAGDGCIKKDGLYLSVHFIDQEILLLFKALICPETPIKYRQDDNTANISIHSVQMVKDLCCALNVPIGKKSYKITLPDLEDELTWHFIRGLIDSDGSIHGIYSKAGSPCLSYCSMSNQIRKQVMNFSKGHEILCHESGFNVIWRYSSALSFMSKLYDNASFSLTRKRCLYKMWKTWQGGKRGTIYG